MKAIAFVIGASLWATTLLGQSTRIKVVDATTRQPIADAVVLTGADRGMLWEGRAGPDQILIKGVEGVFEAPRIEPVGLVMARVSAPDHASILVDYPQAAPREVTVALSRATRVGGIVVDEKGEPVKGALLRVSAISQDLPRFQIGGAWMQRVTSDDEGRFSYASAPEGEIAVWMQSDDPRFAPQMINAGEGGPDVAAFRAGTARVTLKSGEAMAGIVVDEQDRPIEGAQILVGSPQEPESLRRTTTDAAGRFRVEHIFTADVQRFGVTARVPGKSVGLAMVMAAGRESVRLKLSPVRSIGGKIVNSEGKPVRATVVAADASGTIAIDPQVRSDANGEFRIDQLPSGDLQVVAWAAGYQQLTSNAAGTADSITLTLRPLPVAVRLSGTVLDDATGEPIPAFEVSPGTQIAANQPLYTNRRDRIATANGTFELSPNENRDSYTYFVRVEAPGYAHYVAPPVKGSDLPADRVARFEVRLKRADPIRGRVVDSDGKPVAAARVTLGSRTLDAWMSNEPSATDKPNLWTMTDQGGEFALPAQSETEFTLVATDSRGVGFVRHSDVLTAGAFTIKIDRHWGRIEGAYYREGQPVKNGVINAQLSSMDLPPFVAFNVSGRSDDQGRFTFNQVIPGPHRMSLRPSYQGPDGSQEMRVDVRPDETKQLEIGTSGRPVKGKLQIAARGQIEWFATIDRIGPPVTLPEEFNANLDIARQFILKLRQGPEFADWRLKQQSETPVRGIRITVAPDGSFEYGLLAAGFYRIRGQASEPAPKGNIRQIGAQIGEMEFGFVVPEGQGAAVDLQAMALKPTSSLRVGDAVPVVQGKLLDGTPFSMADLKGKYVVINFWATWCGPCRFEMPAVKAIHEEFAKRGDVVVVGMCLDETIEPAVKYAAENGYAWQHVFLGPWPQTEIPEKFGVRGIPTTLLIGPDGKVIAAAAGPADVHRGLVELLSKPK